MTDQHIDGELLPWHRACWDRLRRARRAGRLPHALLVTGQRGVGKRLLVEVFTRSLLCPTPDAEGLACGHCADCSLLEAGTHPDRVPIGPDPESKSGEIRVDTVRRLAQAASLTAHRGGNRVIVVDPADRMNVNASNSLLKTLEEPALGTVLCLVCEQPARLPATIRSRCQSLAVPVPTESEALDWLRPRTPSGDAATVLRLAHGGPLGALALAENDRMKQRDKAFSAFAAVGKGERDPVGEAAAWNPKEPGILLEWLSDWLGDLLRLTSGHPEPRLVNADKGGDLRLLAGRIRPREGHRFLQRVLQARSVNDATLNVQLLYESLLIEWARVGRGDRVVAGRLSEE